MRKSADCANCHRKVRLTPLGYCFDCVSDYACQGCYIKAGLYYGQLHQVPWRITAPCIVCGVRPKDGHWPTVLVMPTPPPM